MHGFHQGYSVIEDLIDQAKPDLFLLQEHWLTPANLSKFESCFSGYFAFGSSAMSNCLESGMLRGRPFGGVMILINKNLRKHAITVHCEERFTIVKLFNYLLINVYLPCTGTVDRHTVCDDLLANIWSWREHYNDCECLIAGDFNTNLDGSDSVALRLVNFVNQCNLVRCDDLFPSQKVNTYVNLSLNHFNQIDYSLVSAANDVINFTVLDPDINFSGHLPLMIELSFCCDANTNINQKRCNNTCNFTPPQLRWDKADGDLYYLHTGQKLEPFLPIVDCMLSGFDMQTSNTLSVCERIESVYGGIVSALQSAADLYVPKCAKGCFKFWWDEELNLLKEASVESNRLWKAAGKPRQGPLFSKRQSCRLMYRKRIKENQMLDTERYSNALHEALMKKNSTAFWQCWRSKFQARNKCSQVDGCVDESLIADKFASHFTSVFSCNNQEKAESIKQEYIKTRSNYSGSPLTDSHQFDTELVSNVIANLKQGKAVDIDGLSAEHLQFCHPSVCVILTKLFQLMLLCSFVPSGFRYSYIVPIPKPKECFSKALTCDDFRGIAISPVISKIFEHCILNRFESLFITSDNQFGFKKGVGCNYAIRSVRCIVDNFIKNGSTANLCAIDLSKAFDKVNHKALYLKLMKRLIPNELLSLFEFWFSHCYSAVKWYNAWSQLFALDFGVRQGSVLSPFLFAIYMDDLAKSSLLNRGSFIILYADDIILIAPTVSELQRLFHMCEYEIETLDMFINAKKSCCIRIGPRCNISCADLTTTLGAAIPWVDELRYLGVVIRRSRVFKCSLEQAKRSFYRVANAIFGKVGRCASEEVIIQLITSKCIPVLLYGLEACPLNLTYPSLDFTISRFFVKLFRTNNTEIVEECQQFFNFSVPSIQWLTPCKNFDVKYCESVICCVNTCT